MVQESAVPDEVLVTPVIRMVKEVSCRNFCVDWDESRWGCCFCTDNALCEYQLEASVLGSVVHQSNELLVCLLQ